MSVSDPVADMLTRVRNACKAGLKEVRMENSRMKHEIARILKQEGFLTGFAVEEDDGKKVLALTVKYDYAHKPVLQGLRRISKPGLRRYVAADAMPRVRGGMGLVILSTSRGVLSDREARAANVGGEVLCFVW